MSIAPVTQIDIFTDEAVTNPWPVYEQLRELGPVVFLEKYDTYAATTYDAARKVLTSHDTFISGKGVGLNDVINQQMAGTILASDGDHHAKLKKIGRGKLGLPSMRELEDDVQAIIDKAVDNVKGDEPFDAVAKLARFIPIQIVGNLIGMDDEAKANIVRWAELGFNAFGPINVPRTMSNMQDINEIFEYAFRVTRPGGFLPGSLGELVVEAMERGDLSPDEGPKLIVGYLSGGVDTTVAAIGNMLETLAAFPAEFAKLKSDPGLASNAVAELLRRTPPGGWFSRLAETKFELDGLTIPEGSRIIPLIGAANRDPGMFEDPDTYDVERNNAQQHVAFGIGRHMCAGQSIAKLELECLIRALASKVQKIEIIASEFQPNNIIFGHKTLTVRLT